MRIRSHIRHDRAIGVLAMKPGWGLNDAGGRYGEQIYERVWRNGVAHGIVYNEKLQSNEVRSGRFACDALVVIKKHCATASKVRVELNKA